MARMAGGGGRGRGRGVGHKRISRLRSGRRCFNSLGGRRREPKADAADSPLDSPMHSRSWPPAVPKRSPSCASARGPRACPAAPCRSGRSPPAAPPESAPTTMATSATSPRCRCRRLGHRPSIWASVIAGLAVVCATKPWQVQFSRYALKRAQHQAEQAPAIFSGREVGKRKARSSLRTAPRPHRANRVGGGCAGRLRLAANVAHHGCDSWPRCNEGGPGL